MLTSLSRFVAKSAQHAFSLFKLLRKEAAFEWTKECEQALQHGPLRTSDLITTKQRGGTIPLPRRHLRGRQRSPHLRDN
ncbi:hypothetical protein A2U01_0075762 [Trifolium medium]|uniref:Uncharacterized protein n=1 Tax=Trifolium medium TaxID=97028 RepID=A0A392T168_9FABA|nr:hypothetical protein [Trifolium medium]